MKLFVQISAPGVSVDPVADQLNLPVFVDVTGYDHLGIPIDSSSPVRLDHSLGNRASTSVTMSVEDRHGDTGRLGNRHLDQNPAPYPSRNYGRTSSAQSLPHSLDHISLKMAQDRKLMIAPAHERNILRREFTECGIT